MRPYLRPMRPYLRKLALTTHIGASVGWFGTVAAFLVLAIAGLTIQDDDTVRGAYLAMDLLARFAIVPLALGALLTGLVQSLGTSWGLFRHWWVVVKFVVTVLAGIVLVLQLQPISDLASVAADTPLASTDLRGARISLIAHAAGGLVVLLVPLVLSVYKPRGMTSYGVRRYNEQRTSS